MSMQCVIRDPRAADAPALAALHVRAFRETHAPNGGGPPMDLRLPQWSELLGAADPARFVLGLAAPDARLAGLAAGCPHDAGMPGHPGERSKLCLRRELQRLGLGRRLVCAVAARFLDRGVRSMLLAGGARSTANGFYEHLGAVRIRATSGEPHGGNGWPDLEACIARCCRQAT